MQKTQYTWLLFDADNTLFDFDKAEKQALKNTFEQTGHSFDIRYLRKYREINTQLWDDFEHGRILPERLKVKRFDVLSEAVNTPYDPYEFSKRYLANLAKCPYLIDGAKQIIQTLSENFDLAIITNGLKEVQRPRFEKSTIHPYISEIIISEEVGAAKPNTEIFDIAFEKMNAPAKHEVLMIGDSLTSDIQGGKNYGIDTCWFNPERKPSDQPLTSTFEIQELSELLKILKLLLF